MVLKVIQREGWKAALNSQHKWPHNIFPKTFEGFYTARSQLLICSASSEWLIEILYSFAIRFSFAKKPYNFPDTSSLSRVPEEDMNFLSSWSIMDITFRAYCMILSRAYFILIPLLMDLYS